MDAAGNVCGFSFILNCVFMLLGKDLSIFDLEEINKLGF